MAENSDIDPLEERFRFTPEALELRRTLDFDPRVSKKHLKLGNWNDDTVTTWLDKWTTNTPDAILVSSHDSDITCGEIREHSLRLANSLLNLGIQKGDVVAIQLPNITEFVIAYLAVLSMGGVLSTLHMPYRAGEMAPLMKHCHACAIICSGSTENYDAPATMLGLRDKLDTLEHIIVATGVAPDGTLALQDLIHEGAKDAITNPPVASDPAILCFTSGTSSSPKAVVHNYQTMLANNRVTAPIYNLSSSDVILGGPPFTHAFGLCVLNLALMSGATSLLMPAFTPQGLVDLIEKGKPTVAFLAPAHIAACRKTDLLDTGDLSSIRIATISGSSCPPDIAYALEKAMPNGSVGQMWGMTECFMGLHTPFDSPSNIRCESLGYTTPTFEARMICEDGSIASDGEEGELEIRGSSVIARYFNNDEANRDAFTGDGWFKTGDLARRNTDGSMHITGRHKDIINRGGIKINPADVEAIVDRHPSVLMSAMAPVADEVLGERACIYVQLQGDAHVKLGEICGWLEENNVAKMKWPEKLEIVDRMPLTPTRKIIKSALSKQ